MLMAQYPDVSFLGYCGLGVSEAGELRELARAGVHELVFRDVDDRPTLLRAKLNRANEVRAGANVMRRLSGQLPELLHGIIAYCAGFPRESHEIEQIALALGVHRKTLVNWCQRARTPPPSVLVTWVRLLLAVEMLQVPGHTVERVARGLGFASGSGFRNLCRRYCGRRPAELRCPAGREAAYRAFARSLERRRRASSCESPAPVIGGPLREADAELHSGAPASY
jgi:AraC-like DNA-binding protein